MVELEQNWRTKSLKIQMHALALILSQATCSSAKKPALQRILDGLTSILILPSLLLLGLKSDKKDDTEKNGKQL